MSMQWSQLLAQNRIGCDGRQAMPDPARPEFRRDADRVTFSTAFRRMQDKTQVFPLADNDYVRTRLTHSLEVSSVGRSLGSRVGAVICQRHRLNHHGSEFGDIVAAAALAHDLGNPPFGHSGEDAIRHWFRTSPIAHLTAEKLTLGQRLDIERYEGNAQGFRLITQLQMPENPGGLQLTYATLGAFTKYPRESAVADLKGYQGASVKKFGFYQSEREHFSAVAKHCGLIPRDDRAAWWCRHPLAFLVEAADDICYRLVDFEDGFRLKHLDYKTVYEAFMALIPDDRRPKTLDRAHTDVRRVQLLRDHAIGAVLDEVCEVFLENENGILAGSFDVSLIDAISSADAWQAIQDHSIVTIYATPRGVEIEAAGFEVLGGLLDIFVSALHDAATNEKPQARSRKLLQLVPPEYRQPEEDPYLRLLRMLDFVSGMTDTYAVSLYKKVRGISLPGR